MNTKQKSPTPPPATMTVRDVYYVLFRHKWLITILAGIGVVGSLALYFLWPFPYTSEAKIFVRYIQEVTGPSDLDTSAKVRTPDYQGTGILNTELQILTSQNLAFQVASNLGPEKILGKGSDPSNFLAAASFISLHLKAEVQKDCDVIFVYFSANDPTVVQPILNELIADYKLGYFEIHLAPGVSDSYLQTKKDSAHAELLTAMQALEDTKIQTGITSLDDAKKDAADLISKTMQNIFQTKAELAENEAAIADLRERISGVVTNKSATNRSTDIALAAAPTPDVVAKYKDLNDILNASRIREQGYLGQFTSDSNPLVQSAKRQRESAEKNIKAFEDENPGILSLKPGDLNRPGTTVDYEAMLRDFTHNHKTLTAKYQELTNQLAQARQQVALVAGAENKIMQATSEKDAADAKYKRSVLNEDQVSIEAAMGNQVSNIAPIEFPTPPARDFKQILKGVLGFLGFFVVLALGLPFLIELVLDQSLKSPVEVQARIGMPFFINIPRTNGHGKLAMFKRTKQVPLLTAQSGATLDSGSENQTPPPAPNGQMAAWDERHELRPFFDTLRDRLMTYFEMINLTHKPKLVAVTSCGAGAGVTSTAAGLASSLSEIGEGNVLLVSMNESDGEAHHFYKGKLTCGIEEVLEKKNRVQAQVQNNLFVAGETEAGDGRLPRVLPKRFSHLVPMMKASDYDYIIFDMPPVSDISITPRLARFMDMVLLVIESGKTSRDAAARVASLLAESKTNVGLVLNKNRSYMPKRLEQTF
jgi:polysaccharide biosynthesis transport protein